MTPAVTTVSDLFPIPSARPRSKQAETPAVTRTVSDLFPSAPPAQTQPPPLSRVRLSTTRRPPPRANLKRQTGPTATAQGKPTRLMRPSGPICDHPFVHTLDQWVEGVPVDCGQDWTDEAIRTAMEEDPHKSATSPPLPSNWSQKKWITKSKRVSVR